MPITIHTTTFIHYATLHHESAFSPLSKATNGSSTIAFIFDLARPF